MGFVFRFLSIFYRNPSPHIAINQRYTVTELSPPQKTVSQDVRKIRLVTQVKQRKFPDVCTIAAYKLDKYITHHVRHSIWHLWITGHWREKKRNTKWEAPTDRTSVRKTWCTRHRFMPPWAVRTGRQPKATACWPNTSRASAASPQHRCSKCAACSVPPPTYQLRDITDVLTPQVTGNE